MIEKILAIPIALFLAYLIAKGVNYLIDKVAGIR